MWASCWVRSRGGVWELRHTRVAEAYRWALISGLASGGKRKHLLISRPPAGSCHPGAGRRGYSRSSEREGRREPDFRARVCPVVSVRVPGTKRTSQYSAPLMHTNGRSKASWILNQTLVHAEKISCRSEDVGVKCCPALFFDDWQSLNLLNTCYTFSLKRQFTHKWQCCHRFVVANLYECYTDYAGEKKHHSSIVAVSFTCYYLQNYINLWIFCWFYNPVWIAMLVFCWSTW